MYAYRHFDLNQARILVVFFQRNTFAFTSKGVEQPLSVQSDVFAQGHLNTLGTFWLHADPELSRAYSNGRGWSALDNRAAVYYLQSWRFVGGWADVEGGMG